MKKMKRKDELKADQGLEQIGITPRIYHFEENVKPFTAITIAEDRLTWVGVRRELDRILPRVNKHIYRKATHLRKALRRIDIYALGFVIHEITVIGVAEEQLQKGACGNI